MVPVSVLHRSDTASALPNMTNSLWIEDDHQMPGQLTIVGAVEIWGSFPA